MSIIYANRVFQLRQLRSIRRTLTDEATCLLVHAFVSSRLDYCNSLLFGMSNCLLNKLQRVQNAAARVTTGKRKFDHITPSLRVSLHCLPIHQRISYKLGLPVFKCLNGMAPQYLKELCIPASTITSRNLRSASKNDLFVPLTRYKTLGPHVFAISGPAFWNYFPEEIKLQGSQSISLKEN